MELNREQIIEALELHANAEKSCVDECPYGNMRRCGSAMATDALSLINELTEENDYWKQQAFKGCMDKGRMGDEIRRLTEENERLREKFHEAKTEWGKAVEYYLELENKYSALQVECYHAKADTVRKMQERLHERKVSYGNITFRVVPIDDIDQIAEEMVEGIE